MIIRECKNCTAPLPDDSDICVYCKTENIFEERAGYAYMDKETYQKMFIEAIEAFSQQVVEISEAYEELTREINGNTARVEASQLDFLGSRKETAEDLNHFSGRLEEIAPRIREYQGVVRESLTGYVHTCKNESKSYNVALDTVGNSVELLARKVSEAIQSNISFYETVTPDIESDDDYNLAMFRVRNVIGRLLYQFKVYRKFLVEVKETIDGLLNR